MECTHINQIRNVQPLTSGCQECMETGDDWVHLRMCLVCGHVGCCDSSKNKHATNDVRGTRSPEAAVLDFCQITYEATALLAGWDRPALERGS